MNIIHLETTGSTNAEVFSRLQATAPVAVISRRQTAGRGRGKNRWLSPEGNLHLSVGDILSVRQLPGLSVRAAVHLLRLLNPQLTGRTLQIKWPNDLILDDAKAGGILVESRIKGTEANTVIGLGINLAHAPLESAAVIGDWLNLDRSRLETDVIAAIHHAMHDQVPEQLSNDLHQMSWLRPGDRIRFEEAGNLCTGIVEGYSTDMKLQVTADGRKFELSTSEVRRVRKETQ